ncbi:MAG: KH domain-containing protein [Candidatus Falkowbacteria bacterium]|nr:MAG: KH domain-containing protein [Candidatus Falkowbacteria bacterium]
MKTLELEETTGKLYWMQRQYLETKPSWQVLPVGEPVLGYLMNADLLVGPFQKEWPRIRADESGVGSVLIEWGYELEYHGNCAFEFGNEYLVRKSSPVICQEIERPLLIVGALRGRQKEAAGLPKKLFFHDKFILDTGENYTGKIVIDSEIDEVFVKIEEAKKEWRRRKQAQFADEFFRLSRDSGVSSTIDVGGETGFELEDVPSHFFELYRKCLSTVFDARSSITPTYQLVLVNKARIEVEERRIIYISVPEEYKKFIIGKGGENIKALQEKLGCKIDLK